MVRTTSTAAAAATVAAVIAATALGLAPTRPRRRPSPSPPPPPPTPRRTCVSTTSPAPAASRSRATSSPRGRRGRREVSADRAAHQLGPAADRVRRPGQAARRLRLHRGQLHLPRLLALRREDRDGRPGRHRRRLRRHRLGARQHPCRRLAHRPRRGLLRRGHQPARLGPRPRIKAVVALSGWADLIESIYSGRTQHRQAAGMLGVAGRITGRPVPNSSRSWTTSSAPGWTANSR